jgi:flagellar basal-body rod protein FlgC
MDFFTALHVSASGLSAERTRVDVAASNLANAESTRGPDGKPYQRLDPVLQAQPFESALGAASAGEQPMGVQVASIQKDETPGKRMFIPGHPDADPQGYVTLPNVNPIHEVVNMVSASRSYDANATAVDTLKNMAQRALDIAR